MEFIKSIKEYVRNWCTLSPDFNFGEKCCKPHDNCYELGGTEEDRKRVDIAFRECIKFSYPKKWLKAIYWILGWVYYIAVRLFGKSRFNYKNRK